MADLMVQQVDEGAVFVAKIMPGASSPTRICGLLDGMLKIKVSAPPQKQKANQCLLRFLAKELCVKKNTISIISGKNSPVKRVQVSGISADMLLKRLNLNK